MILIKPKNLKIEKRFYPTITPEKRKIISKVFQIADKSTPLRISYSPIFFQNQKIRMATMKN